MYVDTYVYKLLYNNEWLKRKIMKVPFIKPGLGLTVSSMERVYYMVF